MKPGCKYKKSNPQKELARILNVQYTHWLIAQMLRLLDLAEVCTQNAPEGVCIFNSSYYTLCTHTHTLRARSEKEEAEDEDFSHSSADRQTSLKDNYDCAARCSQPGPGDRYIQFDPEEGGERIIRPWTIKRREKERKSAI